MCKQQTEVREAMRSNFGAWAIAPGEPTKRLVHSLLSIDPDAGARPAGLDEARRRRAEARNLAYGPDRKPPQARIVGEDSGKQSTGLIGVVPVHGVIFPRKSPMTEYWGLTTCQAVGEQLDELMAHEAVKAIVLDIDSPGGNVCGVGELSAKIRSMSGGDKPIVAQVWDLAASAAYHIASAADEIIGTPSAEVGSIGVYMIAASYAKWFEEAGIDVRIIRAGKNKVKLNSLEPLDDEAIEHAQERVDELLVEFQDAVAKGRGVSVSTVRNEFGDGRVFGAKQALKLGMIDRVATMNETFARLSSNQGRARISGGKRKSEDLILRRRRHSASL